MERLPIQAALARMCNVVRSGTTLSTPILICLCVFAKAIDGRGNAMGFWASPPEARLSTSFLLCIRETPEPQHSSLEYPQALNKSLEGTPAPGLSDVPRGIEKLPQLVKVLRIAPLSGAVCCKCRSRSSREGAGCSNCGAKQDVPVLQRHTMLTVLWLPDPASFPAPASRVVVE